MVFRACRLVAVWHAYHDHTSLLSLVVATALRGGSECSHTLVRHLERFISILFVADPAQRTFPPSVSPACLRVRARIGSASGGSGCRSTPARRWQNKGTRARAEEVEVVGFPTEYAGGFLMCLIRHCARPTCSLSLLHIDPITIDLMLFDVLLYNTSVVA